MCVYWSNDSKTLQEELERAKRDNEPLAVDGLLKLVEKSAVRYSILCVD